MYQRILVAVDGSDTSERALHEALRLAKNQQALLRVAYVVDEASIFSDTEFVDRTAIERAAIDLGHQVLEKARKAAEAEGVTLDVRMLETESVGEKVAHAIVEEARHWPADLLVVGTHGRKGLRHLFMGSIAEGVMRDSPVPILLVRK
jgi:nucleotide-binding universal stress UspA family protein